MSQKVGNTNQPCVTFHKIWDPIFFKRGDETSESAGECKMGSDVYWSEVKRCEVKVRWQSEMKWWSGVKYIIIDL